MSSTRVPDVLRALGAALALGFGSHALGACGGVTVDPSIDSSSTGSGTAVCPAGQTDCDGDGHCDALDTVEDCGVCGVSCSQNNAVASCQAGHCVLACDAGFADCNGDPSDGCEADLANDPNHCQACGHGCGRERDCFQASCVSILGAAPAAFVGADALVVSGSDLYWSTPGVDAKGEIARVPLSGGVVTPVVDGLGWPERLHTSGGWLVWSDIVSPGIYRRDLKGGAVVVVWEPSSGETPHVLDVDADVIYFTTGSDVRSIPTTGGVPVLLASGFTHVSAGHLQGGVLYASDLGPEIEQMSNGLLVLGNPEGTIRRVALPSGASEIVAAHLDTPVALTTSATTLYWTEAGSLHTYDDAGTSKNAGTLGRVMRASLDGTSPIVIADQQIQPVDVAVDDSHVYWAAAGTVGGKQPELVTYLSDGNVFRATLDGGPSEVVMPAIDARNLALTGDSVYFSSWAYGLVMSKQKPTSQAR